MAKQDRNEVPVGAVIVKNNQIIAIRHNEVMSQKIPLAHAEMLVIRDVLQITGQMYLNDCTLYVTLEPCPLCISACIAVRIPSIVFGAYDIKSGGTIHGARVPDHSNHQISITGGILETQCQEIMRDFFTHRR